MSADTSSKPMTIVSAIEVEGDKLSLSFRGLSSKRFLHQVRILGTQRLNDDVTVVATVSTSGLLPFLFGNEVTGWEGLVVEVFGESAEKVKELLEEVVASHLIAESSATESRGIGTGSLSTDGIFITVEADDWCEHFVLSGDSLPRVSGFKQSGSGDGIEISLDLPDGRTVKVEIFGEDKVVAAQKAIAILRSRGAVSEDVPSSFKAIKRPDTHRAGDGGSQTFRFDFSSTQGDPEIYDAAVGQVYPYLAGTSRVSNADREKAELLAGAASYLVRFAKLVRGQGFETLRSLSVSRTSTMLSDPKDNAVTKMVGRALAGRGDDDASVIAMIDSDVRQLSLDATMRFIQLTLDNDSLTDSRLQQKICVMLIVNLMGQGVTGVVNEKTFAQALDKYKDSVKKYLVQPGVIGNAMASGGGFDLNAMRKADKRAVRGRFTGEDLRIMATVAVRYRGVFQTAVRVQSALGWSPTPWDPVEYVHSLGQYW